MNKFAMKLSDALRDLVLFVQLKKREKHPWRSVTLPWVFFTFSKLCKWCQIVQNITYKDLLVVVLLWKGEKKIK